MISVSRYLAILVLLLGVASLVMGAVFISLAVEKSNWMKEAMRLEKITLGIDESAVANGEVVDSLEEAQAAGDTIREHRRGIAATYNELLEGGRFDPLNPKHLSYAQALNIENYLYLAVLGFGVAQEIIATGAFMIIIGFALGSTGIVLFGLSRRLSQVA